MGDLEKNIDVISDLNKSLKTLSIDDIWPETLQSNNIFDDAFLQTNLTLKRHLRQETSKCCKLRLENALEPSQKEFWLNKSEIEQENSFLSETSQNDAPVNSHLKQKTSEFTKECSDNYLIVQTPEKESILKENIRERASTSIINSIGSSFELERSLKKPKEVKRHRKICNENTLSKYLKSNNVFKTANKCLYNDTVYPINPGENNSFAYLRIHEIINAKFTISTHSVKVRVIGSFIKETNCRYSLVDIPSKTKVKIKISTSLIPRDMSQVTVIGYLNYNEGVPVIVVCHWEICEDPKDFDEIYHNIRLSIRRANKLIFDHNSECELDKVLIALDKISI